jgi:putative hemolysin
MTHRTEMVWLDLDDPEDEIARTMIHSAYSQFPVARGVLDNVLGVVQATDLLAQTLTSQSIDVKAVLQPPLFVPEGALAWDVLERFKESGLSMALVIDEYGGLEGVLTLNDVLEALVGDLPPRDEEAVPGVVQRPDGSWLLDGILPIDEFKALFELDNLPGELERNFETLGGFVMSSLGRIPTTADHFAWQGFCMEVMDMDGHRVDKVLVFPIKGDLCAAPSDPSAQEDHNG